MDSSGSKYGSVTGCSKDGNETSGYIQGEKFLDPLSDY
jgi:hypothetical protein